ncbi:MAG TPA: SatD family protein [Chitinophagaceae bacterium]|jgi:hypothetical protein|nr:SatD family protein [Chitinophagaceae bacterium]
MEEVKYGILLGDIVGSRQIADRSAFEGRMSEALESIRQEFADAFALPVRTWKGLDEIAAVLRLPAPVYAVIDRFNSLLAPERLRVVVVSGSLDTWPPDGDVTKADGPAFHEAAGRMAGLKKTGLLFEGVTGAPSDALWNTAVNALQLLKSGWTERQWRIYAAWQRKGSQEAVAEELRISQQMVSKALKAIGAAQVHQLEERLRAAGH